MVFIKLNFIVISLLLVITGTLGACGSAPTKTESELLDTSTLSFIPQIKRDGKGVELLYEPEVNPYDKRQRAVKPDSVELFIQARRDFNAKQFDKAEVTLLQLTETNKRLSGPWVMLGDIAIERIDLADAEVKYKKAIELNRNNVNAYLRLAKVKRMQGDFIKAKVAYTEVLTIWKDFPEAHLNLGILYDIYLNEDVNAQKHIEAYQFLIGGEDEQAAAWLKEIQARTGLATELKVQKIDANNKAVL